MPRRIADLIKQMEVQRILTIMYRHVVVFSVECVLESYCVFIGMYLIFIHKCCLIIRYYDL